LAVQRNEFVTNPQIVASAERAKKGSGRLHLLGLVCHSTFIQNFPNFLG